MRPQIIVRNLGKNSSFKADLSNFFKCFLFFIFIWLTSKTMLAQNTSTNLLPPIGGMFYLTIFDMYPVENSLYVYKNSMMAGRSSNSTKSDMIYLIDSTTNKTTSIPVETIKNLNYEFSFKKAHGISTLYSQYDDRSYTTKFLLNNYDGVSEKNVWNPKEIASFTHEYKERTVEHLALSEDQSKFTIISVLINNREQFKGWKINVYDVEGNLLWNNDINPLFGEDKETFTFEDILLTNDGNVYLIISSCIEHNKKISEEKIHFFTINERNNMQYTKETPMRLMTSLKMKVLKNGNVFIGGYYKEKHNTHCKGVCSVIFNTDTHTFEKVNTQSFPDDYEQEYLSPYYSVFTTQFPNQLYNLSCEAIYETDHAIVMLGEHQLIKHIASTKTSYFSFYTKGTLLTTFSKEIGVILSDTILEKSQTYSSAFASKDFNFKRYPISFSSYQKGNDIYMIYNDNPHNINSKKKMKTCAPIKFSKTQTFLMKIDEKGQVTQKMIIDGKTQGFIACKPLFIHDQYIIFFNFSQKGGTIDKILIY